MSSQTSTRSQILPVSLPTYTLPVNSCDVATLLPGNTVVNLPVPSGQKYPVTILNNAGNSVTINDQNNNPLVTLENNMFITVLGNYLAGAWQIIANGNTGVISSWNITGNALTTTGKLGTTNANPVNIIYNNTDEIILNADGIAFQKALNFNGQLMNNVTTPTLATQAANKNYVDTTIATSLINFVFELSETYVRSAPLIPTINSNNDNASGWIASGTPGGFGAPFMVFQNGPTSEFWGPPEATGGQLSISGPGNFRVNRLQIRTRNGPTLNSFSLQDGSMNTFFTNTTPIPSGATRIYNFPFSMETNTVVINNMVFSDVTNSGLQYVQYFGTFV
jgi:hypothetical protein